MEVGGKVSVGDRHGDRGMGMGKKGCFSPLFPFLQFLILFFLLSLYSLTSLLATSRGSSRMEHCAIVKPINMRNFGR